MKEHPLLAVLCKTAFRMLGEFQTTCLCWSKAQVKALLFMGEAGYTSRNMNNQSNIVNAKLPSQFVCSFT